LFTEGKERIMKKILIVKLSSLGDIVHSFLAIKEFKKHFPACRIDWLVEDFYNDLPLWLDETNYVYSINRKQLKNFERVGLSRFYRSGLRKQLKLNNYDAIIDLYFSKDVNKYLFDLAPIVGLESEDLKLLKKNPDLNKQYHRFLYPREDIPNLRHERLENVWFYRVLLSQFGGYEIENDIPTELYNVLSKHIPAVTPSYKNYLVFIHSTSGDSKRWPIEYWRSLAIMAHESGYVIILPWGNGEERGRALAIANGLSFCFVLPQLPVSTIFQLIRGSEGLFGGDTGFTHMASFFQIPIIRIWGATFVGAAVPSPYARDVISVYTCSPCMNLKNCRLIDQNPSLESPPCYDEITPDRLWSEFLDLKAVFD
jgi:heptosyltransferase-1